MPDFHLLFDGRNGFTDHTVTAADADVHPSGLFRFADADDKVIAIVPPGSPLLVAWRAPETDEHSYALRFWPDAPPKLGDDPVPNLSLMDFVEALCGQIRTYLGGIAADVRSGEIQMTARVITVKITTRVRVTDPIIDGLASALRLWSIAETHWPWGWNLDKPDA